MAIPSRQIGWGTTDNLLWEISKQIEGIGCVIGCGTSGGAGSSGTSGLTGSSGTSGASFGTSGTSGAAGTSGTTGFSGTSGVSGASSLYYGSFYDVTDQTGPRATVLFMKFGNTDLSNGVSITNDGSSNPTLITVANAGKYNIQFSAQMVSTTGNSATRATIWLRKNGTDVPSSASYISFPGNSVYIVAAWNFLVDAGAGNTFQLAWHIDSNVDNAVTLAYEPVGVAPVHPDIPSTILTVTQIG
jgi:hypothetical protein